MTIVQHLDELRTRLLRSIAALMIGVTGAMIFYRDLLDVATIPHIRAMSWLSKTATFSLVDLMGSVTAIMKLACIVGLFVSSPYIAREMWGFVAAGLYRDEKRYVRAFAPASFLLFLMGCVFGYFVLIPYSLYAMVSMMPLDKVQPMLDIGNYLGLVLTLTILLGLVFQLPLVMTFFSKVGLVPPARWRSWRKGAIVGNVVLAAVLAPPDLLSMVIFVLPVIVLYEAGVVCASLASA